MPETDPKTAWYAAQTIVRMKELLRAISESEDSRGVSYGGLKRMFGFTFADSLDEETNGTVLGYHIALTTLEYHRLVEKRWHRTGRRIPPFARYYTTNDRGLEFMMSGCVQDLTGEN